MTKRFTTDNGSNEDVCLVDNLTKKEYESNFKDIVDLMNKTWEQTRRFEKHNQYLEKENEQLKELIHTMLMQIDAEKIGSKNAVYSARIIFTCEEFLLIKDIWGRR